MLSYFFLSNVKESASFIQNGASNTVVNKTLKAFYIGQLSTKLTFVGTFIPGDCPV